MSLELIETPAADYRNARFMAAACDAAYLEEPQGSETFRSQLNLEARLISANNTQVYVAQNEKAIVVAFRGTQMLDSLDGFKDWLLTDANNFLVLPEGRIGTDFAAAGVGARFHRGFMQALADIWEPLAAAVDAAMKQKERPLWITGHSLGGSLALLAAWRFHQQFVSVQQVYTFGAPMIGNAAAARAFEKEFPDKIFRYVDERDIVPKLPTMSLIANEYGHCLAEIVLGAAAAGAAAGGSALELLKQVSGGNADGTLNPGLMDSLWGNLQQRITHHFMTNYQAQIGEKCKELG